MVAFLFYNYSFFVVYPLPPSTAYIQKAYETFPLAEGPRCPHDSAALIISSRTRLRGNPHIWIVANNNVGKMVSLGLVAPKYLVVCIASVQILYLVGFLLFWILLTWITYYSGTLFLITYLSTFPKLPRSRNCKNQLKLFLLLLLHMTTGATYSNQNYDTRNGSQVNNNLWKSWWHKDLKSK